MKKLLTILAVTGIFSSCNMPNNNMANEKAAKNEASVQAFYDQVINAHNTAMVDSFCLPDFVDHNPSPGHSGKGISDIKDDFKEFFAMYPDVHMKTNFMVTKGDTVTAYVTMTGTNSGPMMGMPATNKSINVEGVDIIAIKDGKATERWGFFDDMKMMQQLGLMQEPGKMGEKNMADEGKMEKMGKKMDEKMEKMGMEKKKK